MERPTDYRSTEDDDPSRSIKKSIEERLADIEALLYNPFIGRWESTYGPMYFYADNTGQMYGDDGIVFSEFFWKYDNINDVLVVKYNWYNNKVGILKIKNNNSDKLEGRWEQGIGKSLFSYDDILPELPHSGTWCITNRKFNYTLKRKENVEFEKMKKIKREDDKDGRKTNKKRSKSKKLRRKSKKRTNRR